MLTYTQFFEENLDKKIKLFLSSVADYLEKEVSVDNANFKMSNIFYKKSKNRFKNLYLNNCNNNYNIYNKHREDNMSDDELCIAVLKSGKNKGQLCNKSVYIGKYCKKHCKTISDTSNSDNNKSLKNENNKSTVETIINEDDNSNKKEIVNSKESIDNIKIEEYDRSRIVIDINKFGNFVFGDTGLVFNSEKKIIAKEGLNGEWCTLSNEDIELCKKYKLKYQLIKHERKLPESTKVLTKNFTILSNDWDDF